MFTDMSDMHVSHIGLTVQVRTQRWALGGRTVSCDAQARVNSREKRWFGTEEEAQTAGWAYRSSVVTSRPIRRKRLT
jgi:hypothetical protein